MVKKNGVGFLCHFPKVCINDLFSQKIKLNFSLNLLHIPKSLIVCPSFLCDSLSTKRRVRTIIRNVVFRHRPQRCYVRRSIYPSLSQ